MTYVCIHPYVYLLTNQAKFWRDQSGNSPLMMSILVIMSQILDTGADLACLAEHHNGRRNDLFIQVWI